VRHFVMSVERYSQAQMFVGNVDLDL